MSKSIAIIGSGLIGRMLAFALLKEGNEVSLFERDNELGSRSCGWAGAGMLAPYSELDTAEELIFQLGRASLLLWPTLVASLPKKVYLQKAGTLIVAHSRDRAELQRLRRNVETRLAQGETNQKSLLEKEQLTLLDGEAIRQLEPELAERFNAGLYLPEEGQIDNRQLLEALAASLKELGAQWHCNTNVSEIKPHIVSTGSDSQRFDEVIDCRGLGAKTDLPSLRGVRGEIIRVFAPDVQLNRPVRLTHPRYPLYVVPREESRFVLGATVLESEDDSPVTVQSALELLSAAFSLHPGFANATILEMAVNCRPALVDNIPRIFIQPGLLRVNGLYRHGFLVGPKLVELVQILLSGGKLDPQFSELIVEEKSKVASSC